MHPCTVHITCDDFAPGEHPSYHQGQLIRGTVHVQVTRRMSATLRIEQVLHFPRSLEGRRGHDVIHSAELAKGTWEHGYYRFPFTCTTNHGPPSSDDAQWTLSVSVVDARTDILGMPDRFFDPIPASWFTFTKIVPAGAMLPEPPVVDEGTRQIAKLSYIGIVDNLGLVWGGISLGLLLVVGAVAEFGISIPESMVRLVVTGLVIVLVILVPTLMSIWYFKAVRRRRWRSSSHGAPLTLPQPTLISSTGRQDNSQPSEGGSDATGQ